MFVGGWMSEERERKRGKEGKDLNSNEWRIKWKVLFFRVEWKSRTFFSKLDYWTARKFKARSKTDHKSCLNETPPSNLHLKTWGFWVKLKQHASFQNRFFQFFFNSRRRKKFGGPGNGVGMTLEKNLLSEQNLVTSLDWKTLFWMTCFNVLFPNPISGYIPSHPLSLSPPFSRSKRHFLRSEGSSVLT